MLNRLANSDSRFEVIERAAIERILKEQGHKFDESFDPGTAPELGRLLNVDGIVLGEILSSSATIQGSTFKVPLGGGRTIGSKQAKANVRISARLISTQTGSIQVAQEAPGDSTITISSNVDGVGGGQSSDDQTALANALSNAMEKAVRDVSVAIVAKAATLPKIQRVNSTSSISAPSRGGGAPPAERSPVVNTVEGTKLYIEGGQDLKLAAGDRYEVRQVTRTITINGRQEPVEEAVETIVLESVQPRLSVAHVEGAQASKAKPGDRLEKATSLPPSLQAPSPAGPPQAAPPPPPPLPPQKKNTTPVKKQFMPGNGASRGQQ
jgi:hypothetical protein